MRKEPYGFTNERERYSRRVSREIPVRDGCMAFGKYKGEPVKAVQANDPQYFNWCLENVPNFRDFTRFLVGEEKSPKRQRNKRSRRSAHKRD